MTTAAASSSYCRAWGILLLVVCFGHLSALVVPLVQGFHGTSGRRSSSPPATHAQASPRPGLFLAVPTATAIDEVIATGDEDGAIAEVMTRTDVVPTKKSTRPLATSITEVLTTEGELTAVAAAQQPGRLRRLWRRLRGKKTTETTTVPETTTTDNDDTTNAEDDIKKVGAGIRLNPDFIDRTATTNDEETEHDTSNKPKFVGGQYSTTTTEGINGDAGEKEDTTSSTVAVTVESNREEENTAETTTPIVAATTTVVDEKKNAKAKLWQQQKQEKQDRAAATKRKNQEKVAAQAARLAARRALTRQKIEAKAAATAAARLAAAQTRSLAPTTSSSSSWNLDEIEDETRNGVIVVALLGVVWFANL